MIKMSDRLLELSAIFKENDMQYSNAAKMLGVSDGVLWILYAIRESDVALTQKQIAGTVSIPTQTINSALKKMESDGYVRLSNDTDRRSKQVYLTDKGELLAQRTVDKVISIEMKILDGMSEDEMAVFLKLFHKYSDLLKEYFCDLEKEIKKSERS